MSENFERFILRVEAFSEALFQKSKQSRKQEIRKEKVADEGTWAQFLRTLSTSFG